MYILYIFVCSIKKTVACFLREVYFHSGTELIPLFPYLRAGLKKGGGGATSVYCCGPGHRQPSLGPLNSW